MSSSTIPVAGRANRRERKVMVFNPGHVSDDVPVFGDFYHFPARGIARCTCARHALPGPDGKPQNIGVHAKYDWPKDDRGRLLTESGRIEQVVPADDVANAIVSEEIRGAKGFVILEGSAEETAQQQADAVARYNEFHMEGVEERIAEWERHVANFRLERPGQRPPKPPKSLLKDYSFRKEYIELSGVTSENEFLCETCGADFKDELGDDANTCLEAHIEMHHPASTQVLGRAPAPVYAAPAAVPEPAPPAATAPPPARPRPVPAPAPRAPVEEEDEAQGDLSDAAPGIGGVTSAVGASVPGRPDLDEPDPDPELSAARRAVTDDDAPSTPKAQRERAARLAGRNLRVRAEEAGLEMGVGDKKGLDHGDPDVMADIEARLKKRKR